MEGPATRLHAGRPRCWLRRRGRHLAQTRDAGRPRECAAGGSRSNPWRRAAGGGGGWAATGALIGSAVPVAGTVAGAAIGRAIDSSGEPSELPAKQAVPQVARQHVGDVIVNVRPLPGESPEELAERVARIVRDQDAEDASTALVDGMEVHL